MVVFTCNHCGSSVKKQKVEKHVTVECKVKYKPISLCCMDCVKDFDEVTYVEHRKCVSELERYSKEGFVPKSSSNKGERKQQSYIDIVRSILDKPNLKPIERRTLESISEYENIPRKKNKFVNFFRNSCRNVRINPSIVESVFDLIQAEYKSASEESNEVNENSATNEKSGSNVLQESSDKLKKGKSKYQECKDDLKEIQTDGQENNTINCGIEKSTEVSENSVENGISDVYTLKESSKKHKKLKRKYEESENGFKEIQTADGHKNNEVDGMGSIENETSGVCGSEVSSKKRKKEKRKHQVDEDLNESKNDGQETGLCKVSNIELNSVTESEEVTEDFCVSVESSKKPKKKKRKNQNQEEGSQEIENVSPEDGLCSLDGIDDTIIELKKKKKKRTNQENITEVDGIADSNGDEQMIPSIVHKEENRTVNDCNDAHGEHDIRNESQELSKKQKKEKRKREKYELELKQITSEGQEKELHGWNGIDSRADEEREDETKIKKKDKKKKTNKRKAEGIYDNNSEHPDEKKLKITDSETIIEDTKSNGKFDWKEVITALLMKSDGNEMSFKRLCKKVTCEYLATHPDHRTYEEIIGLFNKKVKKIPSVILIKDKVKLCTM